VAATALDVLSVDSMKRELRIPGEDDQHDDLLGAQIGSAVSFVGRHLRAPLTDSVERHRCNSPGTDRPLAIRADHVQGMAAIRYWPAGRALREEPDTIAVADLGRRAQVAERFCIYPPADGWPEVEAGSLLEVDLTRSITLTARTTALRQAVILACRQLYDGYHTITATAAMYALIWPWRRLDADPPGTLTTVNPGDVAVSTPETPLTPSTPGTPIPGVPTTRYFGWSLDQTIENGDLADAETSNSNSGTLPAAPTGETLAYVWYAVPESSAHPMAVFIGTGSVFAAPVAEQSGTIDDDDGNPLLVGVTTGRQGTSIAGQAVRLMY
jgi:hypothetical protein